MPRKSGQTLVMQVSDALRDRIAQGIYPSGTRLPSEAQMTNEFNVSRTVVREAVAALRADGLVEAKQGAGIFVLATRPDMELPFNNIDFERISNVIEMLELRAAVEVEAAGLAAVRRSPAQEERILDALRILRQKSATGQSTVAEDFDLHLAIADATNNPRFRDFLMMIGTSLIPRQALNEEPEATDDVSSQEYLEAIDAEHAAIVTAILDGNEQAARVAMRHHLKGSQSRYRSLLRRSNA